MKTLRRLFCHHTTIIALLFTAAWFLGPTAAVAQSSGPYVDECSSGDNFPVESTACIYGDMTGLTAYQESDLENEEYSDWYIGQVSEAQIYDGSTLVADSGNPYCQGEPTGQDCPGDGGESSYASTSIGTVNSGDTYSVYGNVWVWYDPSNEANPEDAYWEWDGGETTSVQVVPPTGYQGYINPKYIVIGVDYSPPGSSSKISYTNNTVVGNTTDTSSSHNNKTTFSVLLAGSASIFGVFQGGQSFTTSTSYQQQWGAGTKVEVQQTTSNTTGIGGYTDPVTGLNHNFDQIRVWLNPVAQYTISQNGSNFTAVFNGYGFDLADTRVYNDMDVIGVYMGCLNGYFAATDPNGMGKTCNDIESNVLSRTWAQNNVDGSGPGLTSADLQNILAVDPFSDPSYVPTPSYPGSFDTVDGRFTECDNTNCAQSIDFEPYWSDVYVEGYNSTTTNTQNYSHTETFSVDAKFTSSVFWDTFKLSLETQNEMTWQYSTSSAVSNSNGQTATISIVGPSPGYTGPLQFVAFQDNYFGTWMLQQ